MRNFLNLSMKMALSVYTFIFIAVTGIYGIYKINEYKENIEHGAVIYLMSKNDYYDLDKLETYIEEKNNENLQFSIKNSTEGLPWFEVRFHYKNREQAEKIAEKIAKDGHFYYVSINGYQIVMIEGRLRYLDGKTKPFL